MIKALKREIVRDVMDKKTKLFHVVLFLFSNHGTLKDYFYQEFKNYRILLPSSVKNKKFSKSLILDIKIFIKNLRIIEFFLLS